MKILGIDIGPEYTVICYGSISANKTVTIERIETIPATPESKPVPEEKESAEDLKRRARKPPADGPCKGCGQAKPLNRLMLCYPCWVKKQNSDKGWREGQPHPAGCGCALDCRFDKTGADN